MQQDLLNEYGLRLERMADELADISTLADAASQGVEHHPCPQSLKAASARYRGAAARLRSLLPNETEAQS